MKKLIVIAILAIMAGCTANQRARNFGGTEQITLPPGQKLVIATWKQDNLWYLTEVMPKDYVPCDKEFVENSNYGVLEGRVIFHESK